MLEWFGLVNCSSLDSEQVAGPEQIQSDLGGNILSGLSEGISGYWQLVLELAEFLAR
jgi:hypothetical protein